MEKVVPTMTAQFQAPLLHEVEVEELLIGLRVVRCSPAVILEVKEEEKEEAAPEKDK